MHVKEDMLHANKVRKEQSYAFQAMSKEIMTRTRLRNKFLKDRSEKNKKSTQNNATILPHF